MAAHYVMFTVLEQIALCSTHLAVWRAFEGNLAGKLVEKEHGNAHD